MTVRVTDNDYAESLRDIRPAGPSIDEETGEIASNREERAPPIRMGDSLAARARRMKRK